MKRFAAWLFAPWRGAVVRFLTTERKALLIGLAATVGFLYAGWLLLADKDSLEGRKPLAVVLSPDYGVRVGQIEVVTPFERQSLSCLAIEDIAGPAPTKAGCINWRPTVETIVNYRTGRTELRSGSYSTPWRGDRVEQRNVTPASYAGNKRSDGFRSIRNDLSTTGARLAVLAGFALAVMIGVSTGSHYLRKTRVEDDV